MPNIFSEKIAADLIILDDPEKAGVKLFDMAEDYLAQGKDMHSIVFPIIQEIEKFDLIYSMKMCSSYAKCLSRKYKQPTN